MTTTVVTGASGVQTVISVAGQPGIQGATGPAGEGVPDGGTAGQVLAKASDADFDTEWSDAGSGTVGSVAGVSSVLGDVPVAPLVAALETGGVASAVSVTAEATARANAVTAEATARSSGDATNAAAITAETTRAEGVETLKADLVAGKVPTSQLPAISLFSVVSVANQTARLALAAGESYLAKQTDTGAWWAIDSAKSPATSGNWVQVDVDPSAAVDSVNSQTGTVVLGYADVGADAAGAAAVAQAAAEAASQPLDADLSAIAGLDSTQVSAIASDGAGWVKKSVAQFRTWLGLAAVAISGAYSDLTGAPSALPPNGAAGGDLAGTYPNPTLAVDRITKALLTTKGDVIAATAASTPARVGVGSDGQVLTADSLQSAGVKWAAAAGGTPVMPVLVRATSGMAVPLTQSATPSLPTALVFSGVALGRGAAIPFAFDKTVTPSSFAVSVTTLAAGSHLRLAIYADNGAGKPGALINDYGQVDSSTTGVKSWSNGQQFIANTRYWYLIVVQDAGVGTVQVVSQSAAPGIDGGDPTTSTALASNREGFDISGVTGAAPSNIAASAVNGGVNQHVRVVAVIP